MISRAAASSEGDAATSSAAIKADAAATHSLHVRPLNASDSLISMIVEDALRCQVRDPENCSKVQSFTESSDEEVGSSLFPILPTLRLRFRWARNNGAAFLTGAAPGEPIAVVFNTGFRSSRHAAGGGGGGSPLLAIVAIYIVPQSSAAPYGGADAHVVFRPATHVPPALRRACAMPGPSFPRRPTSLFVPTWTAHVPAWFGWKLLQAQSAGAVGPDAASASSPTAAAGSMGDGVRGVPEIPLDEFWAEMTEVTELPGAMDHRSSDVVSPGASSGAAAGARLLPSSRLPIGLPKQSRLLRLPKGMWDGRAAQEVAASISRSAQDSFEFAQRNPAVVIPTFVMVAGRVVFLTPFLCRLGPSQTAKMCAAMVFGTERSDPRRYIAYTVLPLHQAYPSARLMGPIDMPAHSWLHSSPRTPWCNATDFDGKFEYDDITDEEALAILVRASKPSIDPSKPAEGSPASGSGMADHDGAAASQSGSSGAGAEAHAGASDMAFPSSSAATLLDDYADSTTAGAPLLDTELLGDGIDYLPESIITMLQTHPSEAGQSAGGDMLGRFGRGAAEVWSRRASDQDGLTPLVLPTVAGHPESQTLSALSLADVITGRPAGGDDAPSLAPSEHPVTSAVSVRAEPVTEAQSGAGETHRTSASSLQRKPVIDAEQAGAEPDAAAADMEVVRPASAAEGGWDGTIPRGLFLPFVPYPLANEAAIVRIFSKWAPILSVSVWSATSGRRINAAVRFASHKANPGVDGDTIRTACEIRDRGESRYTFVEADGTPRYLWVRPLENREPRGAIVRRPASGAPMSDGFGSSEAAGAPADVIAGRVAAPSSYASPSSWPSEVPHGMDALEDDGMRWGAAPLANAPRRRAVGSGISGGPPAVFYGHERQGRGVHPRMLGRGGRRAPYPASDGVVFDSAYAPEQGMWDASMYGHGAPAAGMMPEANPHVAMNMRMPLTMPMMPGHVGMPMPGMALPYGVTLPSGGGLHPMSQAGMVMAGMGGPPGLLPMGMIAPFGAPDGSDAHGSSEMPPASRFGVVAR